MSGSSAPLTRLTCLAGESPARVSVFPFVPPAAEAAFPIFVNTGDSLSLIAALRRADAR